jgi:tRNA nucleotidyltransferase (CCA-adding enzyme)
VRSIRTGVTLNSSSIPPAILEVVRALQGAGHQAFLVGGCVRDMMRGAAPKDFDVATSALPAQVQTVFKRVIPTGIKHGTVTVLVGKDHQVEVTTFRSEGDYVDGRRPEKVEFHTDITADLSRRDFTINAMALDPFTQRLVDPFEGHKDLTAKIVRCVGSALERFTEDGLRCLRAVRFATVLDFTLDPQTEAAIPPTVPIFKKVAMERMREEFLKILLSPQSVRGLKLLQSTGLLAAFLPEAQRDDFEAVANAPLDLDTRLAVLLAPTPTPLVPLERLKLPTQSIRRTASLIAHQRPPADDAADKELRIWIRDIGPEPESIAQQLAVCDAVGHDTRTLRPRLDRLRTDPLTPKQLALNGGEIMAALSTGPGPIVGEATRFLMDQVLSDPSKNTVDSLRQLLGGFRP